MPRAKITSKGQVTIPAEVRRELGLAEGDLIAFEVKADYAVVRRQPTLDETLAAIRSKHPLGTPRYSSNREAVDAHVREVLGDEGDELRIVSADPVASAGSRRNAERKRR